MLDSDSDTGCHGDDIISHISGRSEEEKGRSSGADPHSLVLDVSTSSFVDTVAINTFKNVGLSLTDWGLGGGWGGAASREGGIKHMNKMPQSTCTRDCSSWKSIYVRTTLFNVEFILFLCVTSVFIICVTSPLWNVLCPTDLQGLRGGQRGRLSGCLSR